MNELLKAQEVLRQAQELAQSVQNSLEPQSTTDTTQSPANTETGTGVETVQDMPTPNPEAIKGEIQVDKIIITESTADVDNGIAITTELVEDGKTLEESTYDAILKEAQEKAEQTALEQIKSQGLPDVDVSTLGKEEAIETLTNEIVIATEDSKTPEEAISLMAEKLYVRIEKAESEARISKAQNEEYEKLLKKQNAELINLKHNGDKVDIVDDWFGQFAVTYGEMKKADSDSARQNLAKKIAELHVGGLVKIYPFVEVKDILDIIKTKKDTGLETIKRMTESGQREIAIDETRNNAIAQNRPSPYIKMR